MQKVESIKNKVTRTRGENHFNDFLHDNSGAGFILGGREMLTYKLRNGLTVLARQLRGNIEPYTYSNRKQANAKASTLQAQGIQCHIGGIRPIFIIIETDLIDGKIYNKNVNGIGR